MNPNKFIFYRNDYKKIHFEFDPKDSSALDSEGYAYFGRVTNILNEILPPLGLNIVITGWTTHELPSYPEKTIVCILQDEWARKPKYLDKVDLIFRTCGLSPVVLQAYNYGGLTEKFVNLLAQGKALLKDGTGRIKANMNSLSGGKNAPTYLIPLGYYANEKVKFIPFEHRQNSIFFAGSVQHKKKSLFSIKRPKEFSRSRMFVALEHAQKAYSSLNVNTQTTQSFAESITNSNLAYLEQTMNSQICLIPRGANLETFRFYEAIRFGCIPMGETFPIGYFYDKAPIVRLKDWTELGEKAIEILENPSRRDELHKKSLDWWQNICSEKATAVMMKEKILKYYSQN